MGYKQMLPHIGPMKCAIKMFSSFQHLALDLTKENEFILQMAYFCFTLVLTISGQETRKCKYTTSSGVNGNDHASCHDLKTSVIFVPAPAHELDFLPLMLYSCWSYWYKSFTNDASVLCSCWLLSFVLRCIIKPFTPATSITFCKPAINFDPNVPGCLYFHCHPLLCN